MGTFKMGGFHIDAKLSMEVFNESFNYEWHDCYILGGQNFEELDYALKMLKNHNRTAFVYLHYNVLEPCVWPDNKGLKHNWQEEFEKLNQVCIDSGAYDVVEGWFFDEPFGPFTEEAFVAVTKYNHDHFGKKAFATFSTVEYDKSIWCIPEFENRTEISLDNIKYLTDIAYDFYCAWEDGINQSKAYHGFIDRITPALENLNVWVIPPVGMIYSNWTEDTAEGICLEILKGQTNYLKHVPHFGGLFFYTWLAIPEGGFIHGNGRKYLVPDASGNVLWKDYYAEMMKLYTQSSTGKLISEIEM